MSAPDPAAPEAGEVRAQAMLDCVSWIDDLYRKENNADRKIAYREASGVILEHYGEFSAERASAAQGVDMKSCRKQAETIVKSILNDGGQIEDNTKFELIERISVAFTAQSAELTAARATMAELRDVFSAADDELRQCLQVIRSEADNLHCTTGEQAQSRDAIDRNVARADDCLRRCITAFRAAQATDGAKQRENG